MVLPVVKYGDSVLRKKAVPVVQVTPELLRLAQDMVSTMHKAKGVGLAAEQVGRLESLCVIDVPLECEDDDSTKEFNSRVEMPLVMFNPQILSLTGEQDGKEGCLSFPNMGAPLKRAAEVTVQYMDLNGIPQIVTVRGFLARAVQHETDHLQGILYVDRLLPDDRAKIEKKMDSLCKKNGGCA